MYFKSRFKAAWTIKGTQQFHALIPETTSKLMKHFSDDVQSFSQCFISSSSPSSYQIF